MLKCPSSRLLVVDRQNRLLLFRFAPKSGPLAGRVFWATPGGGLDPGETYEQAACRELHEEVGLHIDDPGPQVARREAVIQLFTGESAEADECFFVVRVDKLEVSQERWTDLEKAVMTEHRWWTLAEIRSAQEQIWPEDIAGILIDAGVW